MIILNKEKNKREDVYAVLNNEKYNIFERDILCKSSYAFNIIYK